MSNNDEDDYLSDKFLVETTAAASSSQRPKTYSSIRKEAHKKSLLRNEQNKTKSRRQREIEAREEGLSKSLFERAKEEEEAGITSTNKALSIMMKMGFKPGQSLGNTGSVEDQQSNTRRETTSATSGGIDSGEAIPAERPSSEPISHRNVPLPLNEWAGKTGIGLGKRARSPRAAERTAKMAKMADDSSAIHQDFRERARHEYQERRAEARLGPAQRTCVTLDERSGKSFNVLWLNPGNPTTFPEGLLEALALHTELPIVPQRKTGEIGTILRRQMQADALQPLEELDSSSEVTVTLKDQFSEEVLEEATQFLRLQAQDRLEILLQYLRDTYAYCFWCGVEYKDDEELHNQCPGPNEDDHD